LKQLRTLTATDLAGDHLKMLSQAKSIFSAYDARDPEFLEKGDDPEDHRVKQLVRAIIAVQA
jgi:hypothetical protein